MQSVFRIASIVRPTLPLLLETLRFPSEIPEAVLQFEAYRGDENESALISSPDQAPARRPQSTTN
jgi:hypothetical protein